MEQQPTRAASTEVEELLSVDEIFRMADNNSINPFELNQFFKGAKWARDKVATTLLKAKEEEIREKTEALERIESDSTEKFIRSIARTTLSKYHKEQG